MSSSEWDIDTLIVPPLPSGPLCDPENDMLAVPL